MRRLHRFTVALSVAAVAAVGGGMSAAAAPETAGPSTEMVTSGHRPVPEAIRVPDGNRRIAVMPARGVQTYQCAAGAWAFVQPDAILRHRGRSEVLHTRGPVWTSVADGSSVTAAVQASSPVSGAIPELLLRSTGNRAPGLLGTVSFVQRLNTAGGLAPTGACAEGRTASVGYTADYTFWAPTS